MPFELLNGHRGAELDELARNRSVPIEFFDMQIARDFEWRNVFIFHEISFETYEKYSSVQLQLFRNCSYLGTLDFSNRKMTFIVDLYRNRDLSQNDSIALEWLEPDINWEYAFLGRAFTIEWLEANKEKWYKKDLWDLLCANNKIPIEFFERYVEDIDWYYAVRNDSLPVEFFERHLDKLRADPLVMLILSRNTNIPIEFFEKYARYVDWQVALAHCKLSRDFLERHLERLDWSAVSGNDSTPIEFLEDHLDKIDWRSLCLGHANILKGYRNSQWSRENSCTLDFSPNVVYPWPKRS
jgi:hypothetical protein